MNNKKRAAVLLGVAGLLLTASALSPYYVLHRIEQALRQRDADALAEYVDFPALRESVKAQVLTALHLPGAQKQSPGTLAGIGQALAASLVGPLVDAMISPAGVSIMLATGHPSSLGLDAHDGKGSPESHGFSTTYESWNRVVFRPRVGDGTVNFTLSRQGWFSWKVAAVKLPADFRLGQ